MKKSILLLFLLVIISSGCFAQSAGLNFTLGFPMGEFKTT